MMILTSLVSCVSDTFYFYHIYCFWVFCYCCYLTNKIHSMMSLTMMGITPGPLVRALFPFSLKIPLVVLMTQLVVLKTPLVVFVAWVLDFFSDRNQVQLWHCYAGCVRTNRSRVQRWSTHWILLALKILIVPQIWKSFYSYSLVLTLSCLFWPLLLRQKYDPAQTNGVHPSAFWFWWLGYRGCWLHLMCWRPGSPTPRNLVPRFRQRYSQNPSDSASRGCCWKRGRVHYQLPRWKWTQNPDHRANFYQHKCQILGYPWFCQK